MLHDKNGAAVAICVDVSDGMDKSIAGIAELASEANEIARDLEKVAALKSENERLSGKNMKLQKRRDVEQEGIEATHAVIEADSRLLEQNEKSIADDRTTQRILEHRIIWKQKSKRRAAEWQH
ncbi:hypothetical protein B0A50_04810 [Salinomyces thailandicus]|uniref:Uncharacterized protein n=1 Tax=Salinomyces thailandicus TaxID=706561 RepID=A0A4V5N654_9PEZI|nr:hypothetical protein B0A50_04810 [Salinomyces thailandica]